MRTIRIILIVLTGLTVGISMGALEQSKQTWILLGDK
jgi:hypothetical protein